MEINMDKILGASLGEVSSEIKVVFKKTIKTREYESEVIEIETKLDVQSGNMCGAERAFILGVLEAQIEYTMYCNLMFKGLVTSAEVKTRKDQLVALVKTLKEKAELISGKRFNMGW